MKSIRFTICLLFGLFLYSSPAAAQISQDLGPQTDLNFEPMFPDPGETVTVSFVNYGSRYHGADLIWSVNGEIIGDATNRREAQFVAGELGEPMLVNLFTKSNRGIEQRFSAAIVPTYVDIVIEPQTRVPDFFEGRAVPSVESLVNATAVINNGSIINEKFVHTWILNGKVLEGGAVRGTNQVTFETPRGPRSTLRLDVTDLTGNVVGRRSIYFESVYPELHFYAKDPLHGQAYNTISDQLLMVDSSATVVAEPYNLDVRVYNNPDVKEWKINRTVQNLTIANPYQITIEKTGTNGTTDVTFHVRSTSELLQGAEESIEIAY